MNRLKLLLFLFLVPLWQAKAQQLIYPDSIPTKEIRISPDHAMRGNVSDYLEDIRYFKLEKPAKGWIDWLEDIYTVDGKIVLIEGGAKAEIYIYDNEGKLIRTGFVPPDAVEKNRLTNNVDNKSLYTSNRNKEKQNHRGITLDGDRYNTKGEWQEELVLRSQDVDGHLVPFGSCVKLNDKTWAFYNNPYNTHFRKMDAPVVIRTGETIAPLFRFDTLSVDFQKVPPSLASGFFTSVLNGGMIAHYSHPFSYEVVEISGNGIDMVYKFVLPQKHTVPENIYEIPEYRERGDLAYFQDVKQNHILIRAIGDIIRYNDYLLFSFRARSVGGRYAYSLKDGEFINIARLVPEKSNDFLPLFSMNHSRLFSDGEYLYSPCQSG